MGRKIQKDVMEFSKLNKIDLKEITGTGKDGNVLKRDLVEYMTKQGKTETIEAEIIPLKVDYDAILEVNPKGKLQKTRMKLYQTTNSKTKGERESWNLIFEFNQIGEIDIQKLARFVAMKLHTFTTTLIASGIRSSFSPSKPLWFEVNNGKQKLDFNLSMSSTWNIFVKGKRGKHVLNQAELISTITGVFAMNQSITNIGDADVFKALPKSKKAVKLIAEKKSA